MAEAQGSASMGYASESAGADTIGGIFGYLTAMGSAEELGTRAELIRAEADANATRYKEQADHFVASQKVGYLKSGVALTGSPLSVIDESIRIEKENLSAIRAQGAMRAQETLNQQAAVQNAGRAALVGGLSQGSKDIISAEDKIRQNNLLSAGDGRRPTSISYADPGNGGGIPQSSRYPMSSTGFGMWGSR